jgi:hypothetical protein
MRAASPGSVFLMPHSTPEIAERHRRLERSPATARQEPFTFDFEAFSVVSKVHTVNGSRAKGSHFLGAETGESLVAAIVTICVVRLNAEMPGPRGLIISLSPEIAKIPPSFE